MKKHFNRQLNAQAKWRGKRPLMPTKVHHDKNYRNRINNLRLDDEDFELEDLRRQGIKVG